MTEEVLKEIEERVAAAVRRPVHMSELTVDKLEVWKQEEVPVVIAHFYNEPDARFFCEALKDVPVLVAEIRRLRQGLEGIIDLAK